MGSKKDVRTRCVQKSGTKGPLRWYGGKGRLAPKLVPFIPDHDVYVETFAGGAALLFAKEPASLDVINDMNSGVTNLFRVLRDPEKAEKFALLARLSPCSREDYEGFKDSWNECEDEVERAHKFFVVNRHCFAGNMKGGFGRSISSGRDGKATNIASYLNTLDRLPDITNRLQEVQIENRDFRSIVDDYDAAGTFFYLDPPYIPETRKALDCYDHELTMEDHEELVNVLLGMKGKGMLSGYAHPIYEPLEKAGWKRVDFDAFCSSAPAKSRKEDPKSKKRIESVWVKN